MRIALVHDYLTHLGGAERVLKCLLELYPHAPVYTIVYDQDSVGSMIDNARIHSSFLQQMPGAKKPYRYFPLALMPLAIEQFNLNQYDLVLSTSHSFSKGLVLAPHTMHISYCFTPTRYAWDDSHSYVREFAAGKLLRRLAPVALSYIRLWDFYASQRVSTYLTLSHFVARRIQKYYRRRSHVIAPPVDLDQFNVSYQDEGYYLIVARLVPYKKIELAIDACEAMGRPLKIVGSGPEEAILKKKAGRWTSFLGFIPDNKLALIYRNAKALLFPQEEDFGITPLEAAACGKPTIAYGSGGALETVLNNNTGIFFYEQTVTSLIAAIKKFEQLEFDPHDIRKHAANFGRGRFKRDIAAIITREYCLWQANQQ